MIYTIALIVLAQLLFVSFHTIKIAKPAVYEGITPNYEGIYLRPQSWAGQLGENVVEFLEVKYGSVATISPRYWLYAAWNQPANTYNLQYGDKKITVFSMMGLSWNELPQLIDISDEETTERGSFRRLRFDSKLTPYESGIQRQTELIFALDPDQQVAVKHLHPED